MLSKELKYAELVEAIKEGKTLQVFELEDKYQDRLGWLDLKDYALASVLYQTPYHLVRIKPGPKPEPKPEPKMVPLGPEDIDLHRDLFRAIVSPEKTYVATCKGTYNVTINNHAYPLWELKNSWERFVEGGTTWRRCEKENQ